MIKPYTLVAGRITQEIAELETVCSRAEQAISAAKRNPADQDFYMDSAALSLHDWYSGLERTFHFIASRLEENVPQGHEWHRELLQQMQLDVAGVRPPVLSQQAVSRLDEYLRFRHVLRNVYSFNLQPERIEALVTSLGETYGLVKAELMQCAEFLKELSQADE